MFISGEPGISPIFPFYRGHGVDGIGRCSLFSHARGALGHYLRSLRSLNGRNADTILFPSYICDDVVRMVEDEGFETEFYFVGDNLDPDLNDIGKKITERTLAVIVVHYFGFMRNGAGVVDLCGGKRVSVIEDFAHVMFDDQRLEAGNIKGDAAIFSLRKQFPVPDGGLLFVKNGRIGCADLVCEGQGPLLNKFIKYILNRMPLPIKRSYGPEKLVDKSFKGIERISSISETIIRRHVNAQSIRESRRRNFLCYVEKFTKEGLLNDVELVFDRLGDMDIPYMLPVRLKCRNARLVAELRSMGVPAISWPTLPSAVVAGDTYATVRSLRDNIVLLPLHQDITRRHIDHVTGLFSRTIESLGICS